MVGRMIPYFPFLSFWVLSDISLLSTFAPSLIESKASSAFMYFWVFKSISSIDSGGLFVRATKNSLDFNPALNVVSCTFSLASSSYNTYLLNCFTYDLNGSHSSCLIISKWFVGLFWRCPPKKWHTNEQLSCMKLSMDDQASLLNHTLAAPLKVVEKDQNKILLGVCCRPKVILKVIMWCDLADPLGRQMT